MNDHSPAQCNAVDPALFCHRAPVNTDGVELLKQASERSPSTPVVLLTGYSDSNTLASEFEYGAYGYLEKPVNLEALLAGIRRLDRKWRGNLPDEATETSAA